MKKKNVIMFLAIILVIVALVVILVYKYNTRQVKDIDKYYSSVVKVNKNSLLYELDDNNYEVVGKFLEDTVVSLDKNDKKEKYFKVKDTSFYVYYEDVSKSNDEVRSVNTNYLQLGKIKADKINLYKDDKLILTIDKSISLDVIRKHDDLYDVLYLGNIYSVKANEFNYSEEDIKNTEAISVLAFDDNIDANKIEDIYKSLQSSNYQTISMNDLVYWVSGQIKLPDKVIVLKKNSCDDKCKELASKYGYNIDTSNDITIYDSDNQNTVGSDIYYQYKINNDTTIDRVKEMLRGVKLKEPLYDINSEQEIAVINYHFFYDSSIGEACNESICLDTSKFEEQLQYLKDNGYKTLTIHEFEKWMYGEIELPEKSVLLTVDDGAMGTGAHNGNKLIPILEKYQMHATLFLITGWWDINNYRSPYLDIQSHTHDMHTAGICSSQFRGAQMLCSTKEQVLNDLRMSLSVVNDNTSFCFPFYASNATAIEALKEVGFKIAFIGGNVKAKRSNNKYQIPRYPIYDSTTLEQFIDMVS